MNSRVLSLLAFLSLVTLALCLAPSRASAQAVATPDATPSGAALSAGSVPRLIKFSGTARVPTITTGRDTSGCRCRAG